MNSETIWNGASKVDKCMVALKEKFENEGYTVKFQDVITEDGDMPSIVVTNSAGTTKSMLGLGLIAQVMFVTHGEHVNVVEIPPRTSSNRATAVGMAILSGGAGFPLLFTSGFGAAKQKMLRDQLFGAAVSYMKA